MRGHSKKESSFSEEKEAKRLFDLAALLVIDAVAEGRAGLLRFARNDVRSEASGIHGASTSGSRRHRGKVFWFFF
jgi:hypothetical protein